MTLCLSALTLKMRKENKMDEKNEERIVGTGRRGSILLDGKNVQLDKSGI